MTKEERLNLFHDECKKSLNNLAGLKEVTPHLFYYDNSYAKPIADYFAERGIESKELDFKNGSPFLPMCSLTSSARLCFLYFYNKDNHSDYLYEQSYRIVKENGGVLTHAHPDAIKGDYYYECKCQEVVNGEGEKLKKSYLACAKYFKEIFANLNEIKSDKEYLYFRLDNLNINLNYQYNEAQINVKQLICHLLALANKAEETKREQHLQYIIFVPNNYQDIEEIYASLQNEIKMIFESDNNLIRFANAHSIKIEKPMLIPIGEVKDPFIK